MALKRSQYRADFRFRLALEAAKGPHMLNQLTRQHGVIQSDRPVETAAARKWIRGGKLSSTSQSGDFRWNWSSRKKLSLFS